MSSRRKGNRPFPVAGFFAYLLAEPRSVSMTPIEPPHAVAIVSAVYVLPEPVGPASARRALAPALVAVSKLNVSVMPVTSSRPRPVRGPFAGLGGRVLAGPLPLVRHGAGPVRGVIACVERAGGACPVAVLLVAGGLADRCLQRGAVRQGRRLISAGNPPGVSRVRLSLDAVMFGRRSDLLAAATADPAMRAEPGLVIGVLRRGHGHAEGAVSGEQVTAPAVHSLVLVEIPRPGVLTQRFR